MNEKNNKRTIGKHDANGAPVDTSQNTWWKCKMGHNFLASHNEVEAGYNCPECEAQKAQSNINLN